MILFCGILCNIKLMPDFVRPLQYPDPMRYAFEMVLNAQWNEDENVQMVYTVGMGYGTKFDYITNLLSLVFLTMLFHISAMLMLYKKAKFQ